MLDDRKTTARFDSDLEIVEDGLYTVHSRDELPLTLMAREPDFDTSAESLFDGISDS